QQRERQRIGIAIGIAIDAAHAARRADLPIGPVGPVTTLCPGVATSAAAPRVAGVEIFTIVVSDPRGEVNAAGLIVLNQIARPCSSAAIDDWMQEVRGPAFDGR